ncbi:deoxyribose-phosphate aldolase [Crocosphaera chwakensis CCY0110]|uniref:Deoxyribose-phosphate aldolase n=1 Tax=Crocosphaera chwakensis CCY0110 TaxID=391612 RepID=A3IJS6_9CHRO|nr:deoxyribose-phosphate aldolase [Crocosphaera chwakensis CCY0110]
MFRYFSWSGFSSESKWIIFLFH